MRPPYGWMWPLLLTFTAYLVTGTILVWSRWRYDRRRRILARVEAAIGAGDALDPAVTASGLEALSGTSVGAVHRLAAETRAPRAADRVIAQYLVSAIGLPRLEAIAENTSGRVSRWKQVTALRILALALPHDNVTRLARATTSPDGEVVAAAVATLGAMREPEAAAALVHALKIRAYSPSRVATFLDRFPLDIAPLIRPLASEGSRGSRYWGALLLRRYRQAPWAVELLARLAMDPDGMVRKAALQSLTAAESPVTVSVAAEALRDPVWFVRAHAARALGACKAVEHAAGVAGLLADRQWWVREAAKHALVEMGTGVEPVLLPFLTHPDRFARNSTAEVLQQLGTFERLLAEEARHPGDPVRRETIRQLRLAGDHRLARVALNALPEDLRSNARDVLRSCVRTNAAGGA